ncbi:MAG TPA: electron transfer flavoprotein subunit alpha/FixB family protein [Bacteroidales bacterium]|nr:electron transfer flavoprotein subunit alpha/FixB family protein [Bacteroidales bacterium]HRZ76460.1 electron transfer flavoprotein subunit alpha/FixB family protein [Bacteroidales bacterium]
MSNILYLAEHREGSFRKPALELASYAHALARQTGGQAIALVLGKVGADQLSRLGSYGTQHILHAAEGSFDPMDNGIWSTAVAEAAIKVSARLVVFSASLQGRAIAPAVAVRLEAGLVAGVNGLPSSMQPLTVERKVYSGKALATVVVHTEKAVMTLSPNTFGLKESSGDAVAEVWTVPTLPSLSFEVLETSRSEGKLLLSEADVVVSAGRGMKGHEHWKPVEDLATVLGAATACSRPVSDEGWRPHGEHVGQTGKIIAPNLYFALGISGAVQHIAGVSSSKVIVAVNKDPEAPIFGAADYGILGDVHTVVPALVEAAKRFKENS